MSSALIGTCFFCFHLLINAQVFFKNDWMLPALIVFAGSYTKTSKIKLNFKKNYSEVCKIHQKKWLLVAAHLLGTTLSKRSARKKKYKGNIIQTRGQRKKSAHQDWQVRRKSAHITPSKSLHLVYLQVCFNQLSAIYFRLMPGQCSHTTV